MLSLLALPHPLWVVFLPLVGAVVAGFGGRVAGEKFAGFVSSFLVLLASCGAFILLRDAAGGPVSVTKLMTWFSVAGLQVDWAVRVDTLSAVMMAVVTFVSAMVHFYAMGYMKGDKGIARFMGYLSLFTFFMLMLVSADNLVQLFFGWEGVGLCSYLLINFWYDRPAANKAGVKAFLVNRVGDVGFVLGIIGCYVAFGSVQLDALFAGVPDLKDATVTLFSVSFSQLNVLALLLFVGAVGKSAQLGLHVWLPDAMEGPTPVSALIHAATMVTAGVFMLARLSPLFEYAPEALATIALLGGGTALFAASVGIVQTDIKRVIAYSTMSQLGYMFVAAGVSAYDAALFHLMTHAFFKALLFLGAGSVIHAMAGEQDMRRMGGLWRKMPVTYALMWIGSLALSGIGVAGLWGFAGFYSKDAILEAVWAHHAWYGPIVYAMGLFSAVLTAFYSLRLILLTFHGDSRCPDPAVHPHESSWVMLVPLVPLALGAVFAGSLGQAFFVSADPAAFWHGALFVLPEHVAGGEPETGVIRYLPLLAALVGGAVAFVFYVSNKAWPAHLAAWFKPFYLLLRHAFFIDALYERVFVRGADFVGRVLWKTGDDRLIDGLGPDGIAALTQKVGRRTSLLQSGFVYHYAFAMVLGLAAVITWFTAAWYGIWR